MNTLRCFLPASALVRRAAGLGLLLLAFAGLPWFTGCVSTAQKENWLAQSGFKSVPANTPQRAASLKSLPAGKITKVTRNAQTWYVFPSPKENAMYVGNEKAYAAYRQLIAAKDAAVEGQSVSMMDQAGANPWNTIPDYWDTWGTWLLE